MLSHRYTLISTTVNYCQNLLKYAVSDGHGIVALICMLTLLVPK